MVVLKPVTVRNVSAPELLQAANDALNLKVIAPEFLAQNLIIVGAEKTYEVMRREFERDVVMSEVFTFFSLLGFFGNTAAFIAWMTDVKPEGTFVTVPHDEDLLILSEERSGAPAYVSHLGHLCFFPNDTAWRGFSYIGFKEIK